MSFALSPHIHLAVLGDDVVLLDTVADAYLCVPGGRARLCPTADRSGVAPRDERVAAALLGAGFIHPSVRSAPRVRLVRPSRGLAEEARESFNLVDAWRLSGALWDLLWRYRGRPLGDILAYAAAESPASGDVATPDVERLARLFQHVVVWLPVPRKCLIRSFLLLRFLQRSGQGARWMFGVTTWPFRAHCWLQVGDLALDDNPERIVEFEPILGIG